MSRSDIWPYSGYEKTVLMMQLDVQFDTNACLQWLLNEDNDKTGDLSQIFEK